MRRWEYFAILVVMLGLGALGCGGSSNSGVTLTISPTTASVITNTTQQFSPLVTGSSNTTVTWTVTCPTVSNVTVTNCGTINTNGLYTAPATIPTATISGTVTPEPTATITATAAADTTKVETATVTIITGISIAITPVGATVGTNEHFTFAATVTNPGCNTTVTTTCLSVTWSLPTNVTGDGSIDANGVYTAPTSAPSPSTVVITATSVSDTSITATATVNIVTATDPTVSSISPTTAALGSLFQDVYISGTNFISTSIVYANGVLIDPTQVTADSSSLIRARVTPKLLASIPSSGVLAFSVSQQVGAPQTCADAADCQLTIAAVRPAIVGPSPNSLPQMQNNASVQSFNVNGGFFGTAANPSVTATYDGQLRGSAVTSNAARQLSINIGGSTNSTDFSLAGLHQIRITSNGDATKFASTNLAIQPDANANPPTSIARVTVGTKPSDVAVNPATGMAVVANGGSNDVTLVDLTAATPTAIVQSLCTGSLGTSTAPCAVASGPQSVAVAHLISPTPKDIALVANSSTMTISEIDLNAKAVIWVSPTFQNSPIGVGINPVTGRALVAMSFAPYGMLVDLTQTPPAILGPVSISTGTSAHIAVEPHLNWAVATPGGAGSVGIVDLNRQTTNTITGLSRTTNVVTVTVQAATSAVPQSPLAIEDGDAVQIQGASDSSFNGIYLVSAVGPGPSQFSYTQTGAALADVASFTTGGTVNYAQPVATLNLTLSVQGIAINTETQTAIMADPSSGGGISIFSLIDQSVSSIQLANTNNTPEPGAAATAFNSLTNTAYVINTNNSTLSVIDPTKPQRLPSPTSNFQTDASPVALAVDPATNRLVVANQGANDLQVFSLGSLNTIRPIAISESNPKVFVANSTLTTAAAPAALTLSVLGMGFSNSSVVRLDGTPLTTTFVSNRSLTAIVPPALLSAARRFDLDVLDSGNLSNASDFTVQQSIDVTGCSTSPLPVGVAVDAQQNIADVTLLGCNSVALISLTSGTGQTVSVGTFPYGVAVLSNMHQAVVANNGSQNASIVDELGASVVNTIATDSGSQGVSTDQDTGEAAVANSVANDVTVLNASTGGSNSITTDQMPIATAFNYQNHMVCTVAATSNTVDCADGAASSTATSFSIAGGTSIVYDPVTGSLGNDCGSTTNLVGCFLVSSGEGNNVEVIDPVASFQSSFRIGINPTAVAYNYLTSTIVSTNTLSHTITVGDFLDQRIRAVLTLPPAPPNSTLTLTGNLQFALDIHPFRNLAVIADTANGRVLFVPIPR